MKKNSIASWLGVLAMSVCVAVGIKEHDTFRIVLAILIFETFKWYNGQ